MQRWFGALLAATLACAIAWADGLTVPFSMPATTCSNQFIRSLTAITGAGTCATVGSSDLAASLSLTTPNINIATATTINGVTLDNTAWSSYTPTLTCTAGAVGSSAGSIGYSKQIGKSVLINIKLIYTLGTCTGNITLTIPITPLHDGVLTGIENQANGLGYKASINAGSTTTGNLGTTANAGTPVAGTYLLQSVYESQ